MDWLNYHHLHYFWVVAREGSISRACHVLHLSQPTISGQIRELEKALGVQLFSRAGRGLQLSAEGQAVFQYADEIFSLGRELLDMVRGRPIGQPMQFRVGLVDVLPKYIAYTLLQPALNLPSKPRLICQEGKLDRLIPELSAHHIDVILSDSPLPPQVPVRAFTHRLGSSSVTIMGTRELAQRLKPGFPGSLHDAPFLLPLPGSTLRRSLDQWFAAHGFQPKIHGEFEDSALVKIFARAGEGLCAVPTVIAREVSRQYQIRPVGRIPGVRESFYALSMERKLKHPAVLAIVQPARGLFQE